MQSNPFRTILFTTTVCLSLFTSAFAQSDLDHLIKGLDNDDFQLRDQATTQLTTAGHSAIKPLINAAQGDSLEVTMRCIDVLQTLSLNADITVAEAAEDALQQLADTKHRYASPFASRAMSSLPNTRRTRAIVAVQKLGGTISSVSLSLTESWKGGDKGLAYLKHVTEIQQISLKQADVSDTGLEQFAKLPNLVRLTIDRCPNITDAAVAKLKKAKPNASVLVYGGGFLGVSGLDHAAGCQVVGVFDNTVAKKAGLRVGDVITKIDGAKITGVQVMVAKISTKKPDDKVTIQFLRGGKKMSKDLTLGKRP